MLVIHLHDNPACSAKKFAPINVSPGVNTTTVNVMGPVNELYSSACSTNATFECRDSGSWVELGSSAFNSPTQPAAGLSNLIVQRFNIPKDLLFGKTKFPKFEDLEASLCSRRASASSRPAFHEIDTEQITQQKQGSSPQVRYEYFQHPIRSGGVESV